MFHEINPSGAFTEHGAPLTQVDGRFFVRDEEPGVVYRFSIQLPVFIKVDHLWMQLSETSGQYTITSTLCAIFTAYGVKVERVNMTPKFLPLEAEMWEVAERVWLESESE
jgi:hypothetical protein